MEDVEITDVNDEDSPYRVEKAPLNNQDLSSLSLLVGELLSQYGWYLVVVTVVVYLLIQHLSKRRSSQSSSSSPQQTLQDAALVAKRQEGMEAARMKMQEELDAKADIFREKQRQQEEEKRRQNIEIWESMQQGKSYKGSAKPSQTPEEASSSTTGSKPKSDKKPLRSAVLCQSHGEVINPLTTHFYSYILIYIFIYSALGSCVGPHTPVCVSDYNPLTGQGGSSCAWRPGRRGPSSGG